MYDVRSKAGLYRRPANEGLLEPAGWGESLVEMMKSRQQLVPQVGPSGSSTARTTTANRQVAAARRSSSSFGVPGWLAGFTIVWVVLTCVPSVILIWRSYEDQRRILERHSLETARALTLAIDAEFAGMIATINALATSPFLDGNLAAFHRQAQAALRDYPGASLSLADRSGRQLMNTSRQPGEQLPPRADQALIHPVVESGRPAISHLFVGELTQKPMVAVGAPIVRDDRAVYDMAMVVPAELVGTLLRKQSLPPGWVGTIADSTGTIVARTVSPERFVGQRFSPKLLDELAEKNEGVIVTLTLEDTPVFTAFSRASFSAWSVAIEIPRAELNEQVWRSMWVTAGGVLVLLAAGLALASFIGRRIAQPIRALTAPALAVGLGERVEIPTFKLREAEEVARSLASASPLLRKRSEERDRAEQERSRAEAWLRLAMEVGRMGTWEFDPITRRVVASESADVMFGLSPDGRLRSIADYVRSVHPEDVPRLRRETQALIEREGEFSIEFRIVCPDGTHRWVVARGSNARASDGSKRLIGALFDVSERKAAEAELAKVLRDKEALLAQKDLLLREINHRVKNSLQSVSAMLRLQVAHSQDKHLRQKLSDADQRVLVIARAHEHFCRQAEAAHKIEMAQYLRDLCHTLERAAPQTDSGVSIVVQAEPFEMATDQALAVGLLVNELVTNALKHAFNGKPYGTISVTFQVQSDGYRRLSVADNGHGLPEGFVPEQSAGLGMKLVQGFARSLDGDLVIDSSQSGCRYTVLLPPAA